MGKAAEEVGVGGIQKFSFEHAMFELSIRIVEEGVAYTNFYFQTECLTGDRNVIVISLKILTS